MQALSLFLTTERLVLRPPTEIDIPNLYQYIRDEDVARNTLNIPNPYPDGAMEEWLASAKVHLEDGTGYPFGICQKEENEVMGVISIYLDLRHNAGNVGYWMGAPFRRNNYTTEALNCIIAFGFQNLGLNRIQARYFTFNPASRRVMEKAGMTYEGTHRQLYFKDGVYVDSGMCGILRQDWQPTS